MDPHTTPYTSHVGTLQGEKIVLENQSPDQIGLIVLVVGPSLQMRIQRFRPRWMRKHGSIRNNHQSGTNLQLFHLLPLPGRVLRAVAETVIPQVTVVEDDGQFRNNPVVTNGKI
jgi:hypothetical protein